MTLVVPTRGAWDQVGIKKGPMSAELDRLHAHQTHENVVAHTGFEKRSSVCVGCSSGVNTR